MFCTNCGLKITENLNFCGQCGNKIASVQKTIVQDTGSEDKLPDEEKDITHHSINSSGASYSALSEDYNRWQHLKINEKIANYFYGRISLIDFWIIYSWYFIFLIFFGFIVFYPPLSMVLPEVIIYASSILLVLLVFFVPIILFGVKVRRAHDMGYSGASVLLANVLVFPLIVWFLRPGNQQENKYGRVTKGNLASVFFNKSITEKTYNEIRGVKWPYALVFTLIMILIGAAILFIEIMSV